MVEENQKKQERDQNDFSNLNPSELKSRQIQELVTSLTDVCQQVRYQKPTRKAQSALPGRDIPGKNLSQFETWLDEAHHYFSESSQNKIPLTYASEWILDNYYIIRQTLQQIKEDLPVSFYQQLPKITNGVLKDFPRIYIIARSILSYQKLMIDPMELESILIQFQKTVPLSTGELWAFPIFLRYSLIEFLSIELVTIIHPNDQPNLPLVFSQNMETSCQFSEENGAFTRSVDNDSVAKIIISLRTISEQDWNEFFESVSLLEELLRKDPSGIYPRMDFKTRDHYRKEIEKLSRATDQDEIKIAETILNMAIDINQGQSDSPLQYKTLFDENKNRTDCSGKNPGFHIGEIIIGNLRPQLEQKIGYRPDFKTRLQRWIFKHASFVYLSAILLLTIFLLGFISAITNLPQQFNGGSSLNPGTVAHYRPVQWLAIILYILVGIVPAMTVATGLINWLITLLVHPRTLPKMNFRNGIPYSFQTLVVIPSLITSRKDIESLIQQLELHYLRNPEPGLFFALLTDFKDADQETMPEDEDLVKQTIEAIGALNRKYGPVSFSENSTKNSDENDSTSVSRFYFLHRKRLWNPSEGKWIGWERKRGKLHELNLLLRGKSGLSFTVFTDGFHDKNPDKGILQRTRFVITLDTDTVLPRGAACRLAGTLAHPLNRPIFDEKTGQVISGYTILQPRMEIHPRSANYSWFTRIYSGDTGLDLYTLAVSDAYQDLFGEGIYVGKGIYDVDGFIRSVEGHIPENSVLSHDLLEGLMGRAGLVTDITMIEDYPQNYILQALRQRRWIRGDWQLLPWLIHPRRFGVTFSIIDRWKIFDNLRRSLFPPTLSLLFILGIIFLPRFALLWSLTVLVSLGIPLITSFINSILQIVHGGTVRAAFRPLFWNFLRWLLAVAFLPYEAYYSTDAIFTTLYRLFISKKDLLQWTTAAQTAHLFGLQRKNISWRKMTGVAGVSLLLTILVQFIWGFSGNGLAPAIITASPVLLLWLLSPLIAWWINLPIIKKSAKLNPDQLKLLRLVSRRTWGFFERFVGPEDHWLPPDHFQEKPIGTVAHRTSPTNIGLLLTSTLAAYDLGYLDQRTLVIRLATTLETLSQLERFRGHFLNWYDTVTLQPLNPRYVSTVDSGNLAACLMITSQACKNKRNETILRWNLWEGYLDSLGNLADGLNAIRKKDFDRQIKEIDALIKGISNEILASRSHPENWYPLFLKVKGSFWQDISNRLQQLITVGGSSFDLETLNKLQEFSRQIEQHNLAIERTITELLPWIPLFENPPRLFRQPQFSEAMNSLRSCLPYDLAFGQLHDHIEKASLYIEDLKDCLSEKSEASQPPENSEESDRNIAWEWLNQLITLLDHAEVNANGMIAQYENIMARSEQLMNEMDFGFLYNKQRHVFHIGLNLVTGQLDQNFYDLLASEARIASIIAIAKGDVPQSHWMQLGRPITRIKNLYVLLSWSGTMFEYLMPALFFHSYPATLLAESSEGAVLRQIEYGKEKGVPWGISESGFYRFDASQNYQYRAFGVPGLGFKRGLGDDLVIAPYASLMAVSYEPEAVVQNLIHLLEYKMFGLFGLYEAIDFTPDRLLKDERSALVYEYMAHHQGMIMMAMANFFTNDIMVQRLHRDSRIQSVELLLQEQIPYFVPIQNPDAENVEGLQRMVAVSEEIAPWRVPLLSTIPQLNLLSNGSYHLLISNMGGGYSSMNAVDLTRWRADQVTDSWGTWIYIQEMDSNSGQPGRFWSATYQPIPGDPTNLQVTYYAHMAVFRRSENGFISTMDVTIAPDDPVEIRRIHLMNTQDDIHTLRLTSYGEVILSSQLTDVRHPAFNKMFIESEFIPELNLQIFTRRLRSDQEKSIFLGHMVLTKGIQKTVSHEADRYHFIGRGGSTRNPIALSSEQYLSGTTGATLDPIFSLGQEVELLPHGSTDLAFLTFTAASREELLILADRYRNWAAIETAFSQANIAAKAWLGKLKIGSQSLETGLHLLSALNYPNKIFRAPTEVIAANCLGQPALWRFGISGDYPILLIEVDDPQQIDLVQEALKIYRFLKTHLFDLDLVILNLQPTDYGAELNGVIQRTISKTNSEDWLNQRAGIFVLHGDQITQEELTFIRTAASAIFYGDKGSIREQMPEYVIPEHHLPDLIPTRIKEKPELACQIPYTYPLKEIGDLQRYNGFGGFANGGKEYVIDWNDLQRHSAEFSQKKFTPAPWVNVIGYPNFGFMVSETGSQCTWAFNSGENRLTPWSNDPVIDPSGEILYLRDEETGEIWTPTPLPAGSDQPYRVTHGAGYTVFEHNSHGLNQVLTLFASPEDPVKIIDLRVQNTLDHPRRITATQYIEWVLGTTHEANMAFIIPEYDSEHECLMALNPHNPEFGSHVAFLIASKNLHGLTADRSEFLGRAGSFVNPAALHRLGLETHITPGDDPCAALQVHLDLLPGAIEEIYFVVGEGNNKEHCIELAQKYHNPNNVNAAFEHTHLFWDNLLHSIRVKTPQPATDIILNHWMLYQALSGRIWGRTGFYQSSGAFGFRDQLQDVLAVLPIDPAITRNQILISASRQFEEGDVLHWWHPPFNRGVRTRFSDDLLWLPYVTAIYIESTGDDSLLEEKVPFLSAPPLAEGELERYADYRSTEQSYSIMDHCLRAIEKGMTAGSHGIPLIGTGDWNDGLNRVGEKGQGESVWLAWFLCDVLRRFAEICDKQGHPDRGQKYRLKAIEYAAAVEKFAWDGSWYRRAFTDEGTPIGSSLNQECQIDSIAQSWAILSGAGNDERSRRAMMSVMENLVRFDDRLILLFTPPFDKSSVDPGYIKGYPPGTRENGGQYTHAATWTAWAFAALGDGKQAGHLFELLNPIFHSDNEEKATVYRVEPYVICADIYSQPPFTRRGGWTWYTGSAAWMFRLGIEAILGFHKIGNSLQIDPVIPPEWDEFEIQYRFGKSTYFILVRNPDHVSRHVRTVQSDGKQIDPISIPLVDDGLIHRIEVTMGEIKQ